MTLFADRIRGASMSRTAAAMALGAGLALVSGEASAGALGIEWATNVQGVAEEAVSAGGWIVVIGFVLLGLIVMASMMELIGRVFSIIGGGAIIAGALTLGGLFGAGGGGGSVLDAVAATPVQAQAEAAPVSRVRS